jgi:hypothetical protein
MTDRLLRRGLVVVVGLVALVAAAQLAGGPGSSPAAPVDPELSLALAGLVEEPPPVGETAAKPPRDRAARRLRRAARRADRGFRRDGLALLRALEQLDRDSDAGYRQLAESATRLRTDVATLARRFRRVRPRARRTKQARRAALAALRSAGLGLGAVREYASGSGTLATDRLEAAASSLGRAQRQARVASRRLGCRRPCGSGF